jgi:hypothetical protein
VKKNLIDQGCYPYRSSADPIRRGDLFTAIIAMNQSPNLLVNIVKARMLSEALIPSSESTSIDNPLRSHEADLEMNLSIENNPDEPLSLSNRASIHRNINEFADEYDFCIVFPVNEHKGLTQNGKMIRQLVIANRSLVLYQRHTV